MQVLLKLLRCFEHVVVIENNLARSVSSNVCLALLCMKEERGLQANRGISGRALLKG